MILVRIGVELVGYIALYRKWRPQTFKELVGQNHVSKTLLNALTNHKISHAYLLCGPRGTGKTTTAKIIAKGVNCLEPINGEPCNECSSCTIINAGNSLDVHEIDGASNRGIDEIRQLRDKINLAPAQGKYKVYIIDEVHMLTTEAFNALLKTLEEPPQYVIFILATTEPHKVPATILSRCQRFDFHRIDPKVIIDRLEKICQESNINYEREGLQIIARLAQGGMRDALSLMDQCLSFGQELTVEKINDTLGIVATDYIDELTHLLFSGNMKKLLINIDTLINEGRDIRQFTNQLLDYLRDLLIYKVSDGDYFEEIEGKIMSFKKYENISAVQLSNAIDYINKAETEMRWSNNPRLLLEMAFFKCIHQNNEQSLIENLKERIEQLEVEINKFKSIKPIPNANVNKGINVETFEKPINRNDGGHSKTSASASASASVQTQKISNVDIDINNIKALWKRVLDLVRKNKVTTHAFLLEGKPFEYDNGYLTIAFDSGHNFHKEKIEQEDNKQIIEDALAYLFKNKIKIKCITYSEKNDEPKEDIVDAAIKIFGGNVIEVKD